MDEKARERLQDIQAATQIHKMECMLTYSYQCEQFKYQINYQHRIEYFCTTRWRCYRNLGYLPPPVLVWCYSLNLSNPSHVYNFTPASDYALAAMLLFISNKAAMMLDHLHYYPSRGLRSLPMSP
jgi:hypothetical protein